MIINLMLHNLTCVFSLQQVKNMQYKKWLHMCENKKAIVSTDYDCGFLMKNVYKNITNYKANIFLMNHSKKYLNEMIKLSTDTSRNTNKGSFYNELLYYNSYDQILTSKKNILTVANINIYDWLKPTRKPFVDFNNRLNQQIDYTWIDYVWIDFDNNLSFAKQEKATFIEKDYFTNNHMAVWRPKKMVSKQYLNMEYFKSLSKLNIIELDMVVDDYDHTINMIRNIPGFNINRTYCIKYAYCVKKDGKLIYIINLKKNPSFEDFY